MEPVELFRQTLTARGLAVNTIRTYLGWLERFATHVGKPLAEVEVADLQAYQRHLATERRIDFSTFNQGFCALRSFYRDTLQRPWEFKQIAFQKKARKLPEVLSQNEVMALLEVCPNIKHRTLMMTAYGCGLRVSEVVALRPEHIDSVRKVIRIEQGKGRKDRYVMLPEKLLVALRQYWRACRPAVWLFEGQRRGQRLSATSAALVFQQARQRAGIKKRVTFHSLRHAFATHMLEDGTNVRVIQALLGHRSLTTTQIYTHLARTYLGDTKSPLDRMGSSMPTQKPNPPTA